MEHVHESISAFTLYQVPYLVLAMSFATSTNFMLVEYWSVSHEVFFLLPVAKDTQVSFSIATIEFSSIVFISGIETGRPIQLIIVLIFLLERMFYCFTVDKESECYELCIS
ncbi:hypothetical protein CsSME_00004266 [Camellia sinensis var. sinensis]